MLNVNTLTDALEANKTSNRSITFIEAKDNETVVSFAELYERALNVLHYLQSKNLNTGDELIIITKNNQQFIEVFWACLFGGIIPVPVAVGISDEHRAKLFKIFQKLRKGYLISNSDFLQRVESYATEHNKTNDYTSLKNKTLFFEEIKNTSQQGQKHSVSPQDTAFIQFSSGSTSDPKGVILTHKNIMANINAIKKAAHHTEDDISLSWMPLTHDMGLIGFHLNMLACNINQFLIPTDLFSRRPLLWLQQASSKKATVLCSPNFGYRHFLKALGNKTLENVDLSQVRLIYNGAEPISLDLCDEFLSKLAEYGLKQNTMFTVYGLAEATLAVSFPEPGTDYRALYVDRHKLLMGDAVHFVNQQHPHAVAYAVEGKPVADCEIKITDAQNTTLKEGFIGNVQIKGSNVTQGYYLNEQANATALTGDGWLNTGDQGFIKNAELIISGRTKDIIFANGLNYYPHDLESIALQHQDIELGKIVAYGVQQEKLQRDELILFILYRKDLPSFAILAKQVARIIIQQTGLEVDHVIPIKRIPKTTSGKIQRRILADEYQHGDYDDLITQLDQLQSTSNTDSDEQLSELERELKQLSNSTLTDTQLNINDNFFDAGISSLALAEIHQKIDDAYPHVVDITDLFDHQTIAELASFMTEKIK